MAVPDALNQGQHPGEGSKSSEQIGSSVLIRDFTPSDPRSLVPTANITRLAWAQLIFASLSLVFFIVAVCVPWTYYFDYYDGSFHTLDCYFFESTLDGVSMLPHGSNFEGVGFAVAFVAILLSLFQHITWAIVRIRKRSVKFLMSASWAYLAFILFGIVVTSVCVFVCRRLVSERCEEESQLLGFFSRGASEYVNLVWSGSLCMTT